MRRLILLFALAVLAQQSPTVAAEPAVLWQIGTADNNTAELALGPAGYQRYKEDPLFLVGLSEPKQDWPYVQPGPSDGWAGGREHPFTIVFSLAKKPAAGQCKLLIDLADTQNQIPPRLEISVNGRVVASQQMPKGVTDASVFGDPTKGREHKLAVSVPVESLRVGTNEIAIVGRGGSWVLYDWVGFEAPAGTELAPPEKTTLVYRVSSLPTLVERQGKLYQTVAMTIRHVGDPCTATVRVGGGEPQEVPLRTGAKSVEAVVPAVEAETETTVEVALGGKTLASQKVVLKPVRKWTVYLLPHSHVDIGYTKIQTDVERDHWQYLESAIAAARRTAGNPKGAQFKWNVEVLWAVESYLKQASPDKRKEFFDAVRNGWVGLDALYCNELTALCRREELLRLVDYSQRLGRECGVTVDSMMISDVPGYTWGTVTALSAAGVKYMSVGPNGGDRIGYTLEAWADKPFWWIGPDGQSRVLMWIPEKGYWRAFSGGDELLGQLQRYESKGYPYDMIQVRYCLGDNHGPAFELCDLVKQWNAKYAYPKLVIATTSEMMHEFERRYGDKLPQARGDFTPYWEDGAASSANETSMNRGAAEQLAMAETLYAMLQPLNYPADKFWQAWRNVVLYDEHTWGAHNSISEPDSPFVLGQWKIKQAFALDGSKQATELRLKAIGPLEPEAPVDFQVVNTLPWPVTRLAFFKGLRGTVLDADGKPVPTQRLHDGTLAFLAKDVPGLGSRRYSLRHNEPIPQGKAKGEGNTLTNGTVTVTVDPQTGTIASLRTEGIAGDLVDRAKGPGLNEYLYVPGKDPAKAQRVSEVKVAVVETGPLVAAMDIESAAPGCRKLTRRLSLIDGTDFVGVMNTVEKQKVRSKEGVHFAFPFAVPNGVMRMETPWAVVRPEEDQLPGACKNWFTVERFVDVSNERFGVTWVTRDAPLVEVGGITAELPWIRKLDPSQTLLSYVMNNYWHTNYKADQEGPTQFGYAIRPHAGAYDGLAATRFAMERCRPLQVVPCSKDAPAVVESLLTVSPPEVLPVTVKPSADGRALIVRLYNVGSQPAKPVIKWRIAPKSVAISNLAEEPVKPLGDDLQLAPYGLVTLRADL